MGLTEDGLLAARRDPASLAGYLELHIEQGPVLERAGIDIGIVTGIVGSSSFRVVFEGEARHAGTTPMDARRDAAVGAAAFVLGVRETVTRDFPGCVATVGDIEIEPGLVQRRPRTRPASPRVPLARTPGSSTRWSGRSRGERTAEARARSGSSVTIARVGRWEPAPTDGRIRDDARAAAAALGLIDDGAAVRRGPRRAGARGDHAERDGVRAVRRRRSATTRRSTRRGRTASTAPTCCSDAARAPRRASAEPARGCISRSARGGRRAPRAAHTRAAIRCQSSISRSRLGERSGRERVRRPAGPECRSSVVQAGVVTDQRAPRETSGATARSRSSRSSAAAW